jgi:large subunit ribosomal protein L10
MANLVNQILLDELKSEFGRMGSCLIVSFDKLTVADAENVRKRLREKGLRLRIVKNRLAVQAFAGMQLDLKQAFRGKCGVVMAPEEHAIAAAKVLREAMSKRKEVPLVVTAGVIEGQPIVGAAAAAIADLPDKNTVRSLMLGVLQGPARQLATCVQAVAAGLARVVQARVDKAAKEAPAA